MPIKTYADRVTDALGSLDLIETRGTERRSTEFNTLLKNNADAAYHATLRELGPDVGDNPPERPPVPTLANDLNLRMITSPGARPKFACPGCRSRRPAFALVDVDHFPPSEKVPLKARMEQRSGQILSRFPKFSCDGCWTDWIRQGAITEAQWHLLIDQAS